MYHGGINSCERCTVKGKTLGRGRVIFDGTYGVKRDKDVFDALGYSKSAGKVEAHQKGASPFSGTIDCVNDIIIDLMHVIYQGMSPSGSKCRYVLLNSAELPIFMSENGI